MKIANIVLATLVALFSVSASAENISKGIYANTGTGLKQCLSDVADGDFVGYVPTLNSPINKAAFTMKKVGGKGACLTGAHVTGDDGKGSQVAIVSVSAGFEYGEAKGVLRMAACSNAFTSVKYPNEEQSSSGFSNKDEIIEIDTKVSVVQQIVCVQGGKEVNATSKVVEGRTVWACPEIRVEVPVKGEVKVDPANCTNNCTPQRNTGAGEGVWCGKNNGQFGCNFQWKVLATQDQQQNCGCQVKVPSTGQVIGFLDAQPGSARCLQQKQIWSNALGLVYNESRPPQ